MRSTVIALFMAVSPNLIAQEVASGMSHAEVLPFQQMLTVHTNAINSALQAITTSMKTCGNAGMVYAPGATGANGNGCIDLPITKCAKAGKDYHPTATGADAGGCIARGIPAGTVAAFNLTQCPGGWNDMASLAGRVIVGTGTLGADTYGLRTTGGTAFRTLAAGNLPAHRHAIQGGTGSLVYEAKSDSHATVHALNTYYNWGTPNAQVTEYTDHYPATGTVVTPFDNRQPFLALRYCIKN